MGNIENQKSDSSKDINNTIEINISDSNSDTYNSSGSKVKINEDQSNLEQNQEKRNQSSNNKYSLLSSNINYETNDKIINKNKKKKFLKKKKRKKNIINNNNTERNYYKNIFKKKSIIGICLNIFFWVWTILVLLDHNRIIKFPRASSDKKIDMIYTGANSDSFWGGFFSTLITTIFNYIFVFIYPEIIFILSYIIYVVYSFYITPNDKFKDNSCLLSHNMYIFVVFIGFGEIYKLYARKFLDI